MSAIPPYPVDLSKGDREAEFEAFVARIIDDMVANVRAEHPNDCTDTEALIRLIVPMKVRLVWAEDRLQALEERLAEDTSTNA